jgi:hypothetical protein
MANEITLTNLLDAICSTIHTAMPEFAVVEAHRVDRKPPATPACLVEMTELDLDDSHDDGQGLLCAGARFEATAVVDFKDAGANGNSEIFARVLALKLAATVRQQRWGLKVGAAELISGASDSFNPQLLQYSCFRIEWQQEVEFGTSVWAVDPNAKTPSGVMVGFSPNIGAGHEDDYKPLTEASANE